jgi:Holliday junction resolvasome RuvABC endonuclease subunit
VTTVGVDCGIGGALAYYDHKNGVLQIEDMPVYKITVNKSKRHRVDDVALLNYFEMATLKGADRVVIEQLWERPGQRGMFILGVCAGLVRMACIANKLPIDEVPPQTWKKILRVPGGLKADDQQIMQRADDMLPAHRHLFRGVKGGRLLDRAEAAMLAYYGETYLAGISHADPTPEAYTPIPISG